MLVFAVVGGGCDNGAANLNEAVPDIRLSESSLDFGEVQMGYYRLLSIAVYNDGSGWLTVSDAVLGEGSGTAFDMQAPGREVAPGAWVELSVMFAPNHEGSDHGTVRITSDDPDSPEVELYLAGVGVQPQVEVSPSLLYFPTTISGEQSQEVQVASVGSGPLSLLGVEMEGGDPVFSAHLPEGMELPFLLAPGLNLTVTVTFSGDDGLSHSDRLLVMTDDPDGDEAAWPVDVVAGSTEPGGDNHDPLVEITAPDDLAAFYTGTPILFAGQVADADQAPDQIAILWQSSIDGYFASGFADASGGTQADTSLLSPGEHVITLIARDGEGAEASDSVEVLVWDDEDEFVFVLSGGETPWDFWHVDDDVTVYINGMPVMVDDDDHENSHAPLEFTAQPGDGVRVVAEDQKWCTKALDALWLHAESGAMQALNEELSVSACEEHPDFDPEYIGPWPNDFFDQEWVISIP